MDKSDPFETVEFRQIRNNRSQGISKLCLKLGDSVLRVVSGWSGCERGLPTTAGTVLAVVVVRCRLRFLTYRRASRVVACMVVQVISTMVVVRMGGCNRERLLAAA